MGTVMNCKQVQELLPLYAGRDLEEKRARLVTAHVQSCAECAGSAAEYHETRQLLQEFAPPSFSEADFAGIRHRVLREIEREGNTPGLSRLFASLFRPRLSWAIATALFIVVSVFAFYFIANRGNDRGQLADVHPKGPSQGPATASSSPAIPTPREETGPSFKNTDQSKGADTAIGGSGDRTRPTQRRKSLGVAADRQTTVAVNTPDTAATRAGASPNNNNAAEPDAVPALAPATSEKMLRVEMQTKDPNIRIIWFSLPRTKQESPGKFSRGV